MEELWSGSRADCSALRHHFLHFRGFLCTIFYLCTWVSSLTPVLFLSRWGLLCSSSEKDMNIILIFMSVWVRMLLTHFFLLLHFFPMNLLFPQLNSHLFTNIKDFQIKVGKIGKRKGKESEHFFFITAQKSVEATYRPHMFVFLLIFENRKFKMRFDKVRQKVPSVWKVGKSSTRWKTVSCERELVCKTEEEIVNILINNLQQCSVFMPLLLEISWKLVERRREKKKKHYV